MCSQNNQDIKVSVLMGIYNCADTLAESIESILNQTHSNIEFIMCDDGSTDNTYEIANKYAKKDSRIVLLRNEQNITLGPTLNKCLEHATGKYCARMDGDDVSVPDRFEKQVAFLESHPEFDAVGSFMQIYAERLLQSTGRTVLSMVTQATGAITNIILDPIFIFGWFGLPAMGMAGAAIATVIGQWLAAMLGLYLNEKYNPEVQFGRRYAKLDGKIVKAILTVGIPSIIMNAIGSVMNFGMNQILQGFTETATGVFGIYFKIQSFFFMPLFGLNGATISIIAFNFGARKPERIMKTLKLACSAGLTLMVTGLLVFQFAPDLLLGMFNPTEEFLVIGRACLRTISFSFPVAAVCIILSASFQALGNGIYATITSICRQLVVLLPAAYLLSLTGNVNMVWLAYPIAEVASGAATMFFFLRIYRQKIQPLFK